MLRNLTFRTLAVAGCSLVLSCILGGKTENVLESAPLGMVKIRAKNQTFSLGSTAPASGPDERPVLFCGFTYDYWMDSAEVTISQYHAITGKIPAKYGSIKGADTDAPVCFVSWFDAILFCNARSKKDNLDTVYEFHSIDSTEDGRVYDLDSLSVRYEKNGYRLPTEAEWEFAARAGASDLYAWGNSADAEAAGIIAWYVGNSDNRAHEVAQLTPNNWGLYDMFGNALEWVNDVKGNYPDHEVTNFVGGISVKSQHRSVKGGSFAHGINKLRYASRSDVYATVASTATRYTGFRCVLGPFGQAKYSGPETAIVNTSPVHLLRRNLDDIVSNGRKKMVFINKTNWQRHLCYVDFSEPNPRVYQFDDMAECYLPTISPDGEWVAFCTGGEGRTGTNSSVYVRRLDRYGSGLVKLPDEPAFVPRWTYNADSKETWLIYATSTMENSSKAWWREKTYKIKFNGGAFESNTLVVEGKGAFHGGLSRDDRYIATGYDRLFFKDRVSGSTKVLFTGPQNGKGPEDTSQVCNVSISQNRGNPDQVLFLDFGSPDVSSLTGFAYGIHEVIFVGNSTNEVLYWVKCPSSFDSWDHPEWAWDAPVAAATVRSQKGEHPAVFIVDPVKNVSLKVVEGQDLWHPFLWTGPDVPKGIFQVNYDSALQYNMPPSHSYQHELASKMPLFWLQNDSLELIFLGSSGIRNSIDPEKITPYKGLNLAIGGGDLPMAMDMVQNYVIPHCPEIKVVGISLDIGWLNRPGGNFSWYDGFVNTAGYNYDKNHDFWRSGIPAKMKQIARVLCPGCATNSGYPGLGDITMGWGESAPLLDSDYKWTLNSPEVLKNLDVIKKTAEDLASRKIHLLVLNPPLSPRYKSQDYYGTWGPSQKTARSILDTLNSIDSINPYFHFYDAHLYGEHDYTEKEAHDFNHLNRKGAAKLTGRIMNLLKSFLE